MASSRKKTTVSAAFLVDTRWNLPIRTSHNNPVRSFNDVLSEFLDKNADDILPDWSTDDLEALLANAIRYPTNREGVEIFAKEFEHTSVDDLLHAIDTIRQINKKLLKARFILPSPSSTAATAPTVDIEDMVERGSTIKPNCNAVSQGGDEMRPSTSREAPPVGAASTSPERVVADALKANRAFGSWSSAALVANRQRRILDESVILLPKAVLHLGKLVADGATQRRGNNSANVPISESPFMRCNNMLGAPSYERIFHHIASMLSSRSVSKVKSLDAAILLNIFDELEADVTRIGAQHFEFFRKAFGEMAKFDNSEFKIADIDALKTDNYGAATTNVFGLPDELTDFSGFVNDDDNERDVQRSAVDAEQIDPQSQQTCRKRDEGEAQQRKEPQPLQAHALRMADEPADAGAGDDDRSARTADRLGGSASATDSNETILVVVD